MNNHIYLQTVCQKRVERTAVNFQSVIGLSEYSGLECLDNSVTRQEVAFWRTFSLGNNRDYTNWAGTKLLLSQPLSSRLSIHYDYYSVKMPERSFLAMQPRDTSTHFYFNRKLPFRSLVFILYSMVIKQRMKHPILVDG